MENQFPGKKIGKLSAEQTAKRRQQLEAFLQELLDTILSSFVKSTIDEFLGIMRDPSSAADAALPTAAIGGQGPKGKG